MRLTWLIFLALSAAAPVWAQSSKVQSSRDQAWAQSIGEAIGAKPSFPNRQRLFGEDSTVIGELVIAAFPSLKVRVGLFEFATLALAEEGLELKIETNTPERVLAELRPGRGQHAWVLALYGDLDNPEFASRLLAASWSVPFAPAAPAKRRLVVHHNGEQASTQGALGGEVNEGLASYLVQVLASEPQAEQSDLAGVSGSSSTVNPSSDVEPESSQPSGEGILGGIRELKKE